MSQAAQVKTLLAKMESAERKITDGQTELASAKAALAKLLTGGGPLPKQTSKAPTKTKNSGKAATGITEKVAGVFADGKVHSAEELRKRFNIDVKPMKKAISRLKKSCRIRQHGPVGSGEYVRATGNTSAKVPSIKKSSRKKR